MWVLLEGVPNEHSESRRRTSLFFVKYHLRMTLLEFVRDQHEDIVRGPASSKSTYSPPPAALSFPVQMKALGSIKISDLIRVSPRWSVEPGESRANGLRLLRLGRLGGLAHGYLQLLSVYLFLWR